MKFAKVFDTCEKHQILVRLDVLDDMPSLVFTTHVDDVGYMTVAHGFEDHNDALAAFEGVTAGVAKGMVAHALKELREQMTEGTVH